jgi:hypothetical protein
LVVTGVSYFSLKLWKCTIKVEPLSLTNLWLIAQKLNNWKNAGISTVDDSNRISLFFDPSADEISLK